MTEQKKLHVHLIKKGEDKYDVHALSVDKVVWFVIPDDTKELKLHPELLKIKTVINSTTSIAKIGGYRKVTITLRPDLKNKYFDEEENFCIGNHYLEELNVDEASALSKQSGESKTANEALLVKRIQELESCVSSTAELSLDKAENKFLLTKFNGKQDASSWIDSFEKECIRFKMIKDTTKVEALKLFIEGFVKDWYSSNLIKLPLSNWEAWKKSFLLVYGKKNWSTIRIAFNYKYVFGSIIDFVVKKERLLLEADKNIPELFRIYQIVYNLPLEIQDKLERDKIETMDDLIKELKKFDDSYVFKKRLEEKIRTKYDEKKFNNTGEIEKKPCPICEALGYKNRYHPTQICRNKTKSQTKNKINFTELDKDSDNEPFRIEMQQDDIYKKN